MGPGQGRADADDVDRTLQETLGELDVNAPRYNEWLRALVAPAARGRVLELGAGLGTFSVALLQTADHVVAVEPSARAASALMAAVADEPRVTAVEGLIADAVEFGPFDGAVLSNVLEHIDDDEATLRGLFAVVRPGGRVAVFSPAFNGLMSDFDRSIGHVRRYRLEQLRDRFRDAGFEIDEARYVNLPGFFAWWLVAKVLRRRPTASALSRTYDRVVVPVARRIEAAVRPPFGQSVLVIGRVPTAPVTTR